MKLLNVYSEVLAVVGAIILILAIVLGFVVFPKQVESKIKAELRLTRGTTVWNKWVEIESPVYTSFYIFHVTNPDQVMNEGAMPILEERGPYVYKQRRWKVDPKVENCKETVRYTQNTMYTFDYERSGNLTEEDLVNVVNVPFVSVITVAAVLMPDKVASLSAILSLTDRLIRQNVKVGDLLFSGMDAKIYFALADLAPLLPEEFKDGTFALYRSRNGTSDGEYEVYTGALADQTDRFGEIKTWKNDTSLPYWSEEKCNKLGGTDGSVFRPFLKEEDSITIFSSDLCRLLRLEFKEEVTVKDLKGYRFVLPKAELQGSANNADNKCYCRTGDDCRDGVIDLGACKNGAPLTLSTPYFLDGYPEYAKDVGLDGKADIDKHETQIDIEPRTGLLLQAHKRIQLNLNVKQIENVLQLANVKKPFLFPLMYLDEEASICQVDVDDFKSRIVNPIRAVTIVRWVAVGVAGVFFILAVAIPFVCKRKSKDTV